MRFLRNLAVAWAANAIVLLAVTAWLEDVTNDGAVSLLLAAAVFGVLNSLVKPLLHFVTLPIALIAGPIVRLPIAMLMLWLTTVLADGFEIDGFAALLTATLAAWVVNLGLDILEWLNKRRDGD